MDQNIADTRWRGLDKNIHNKRERSRASRSPKIRRLKMLIKEKAMIRYQLTEGGLTSAPANFCSKKRRARQVGPEKMISVRRGV